jgi:hypothetical protein
MAKKKVEDPIEGEATQDQVVEETTTEETQNVTEEAASAEVTAEKTIRELQDEFMDLANSKSGNEAKPEKPLQIGADGNPILPAEEHVKNWGKMTTVPYGQESAAPESE